MATYLITLGDDSAETYTAGMAQTKQQLASAGITDCKLMQSYGWKIHVWQCDALARNVAWLMLIAEVKSCKLVSET